MPSRRLVIGLVLMGALLGPATARAAESPLCSPPATQQTVAGTFPGTLSFPALHATLVGLTGSYTGHIGFEPIAAPPPALSDGCKENSRFTLTGFTGSLTATLPGVGTVVLLTTQPITASLSLHFGTEPNKPILTFRSDRPVLLGTTPVQVIQIVGGELVQVP